MDRPIGFSTGALARGDFRAALGMLRGHRFAAVELSALRENELRPLLDALDQVDVAGYDYVSVHAPSRWARSREVETVELLSRVACKGWPVVVHPDSIGRPTLWQDFGPALCLENMDKRKPIGRTVAEMEQVFRDFPLASWCFDIGHARQIDPTMCVAAQMLRRFGGRLRQVHISEVDSRCLHEPISYTAMRSYRTVAGLIPAEVPIIIEATPGRGGLSHEAAMAAASLQARGSTEIDEHTIVWRSGCA